MPAVYFGKSGNWVSKIAKQTPGKKEIWGNVEAVCDVDAAEYQVVMNSVPRNSPGVKTLLFAREPPCLLPESRWESLDVYRTYPTSETHIPQIWRFDKTYDELESLTPPEKSKDLSWIISNKGQSSNPSWFRYLKWYRKAMLRRDYRRYRYKYLPFTRRLIERGGTVGDLTFRLNNGVLNYPTDGHIVRMEFLERLSDSYPELLDVYGWGTWNRSKTYYKGTLADKWDGLAPYRYSLAIDNYRGPNYFGKITGPLLAWCMPIQWGCTNLSEYIPEDSYAHVDIEDKSAPEKIKRIVESDRRERNLDAIAEARERILDEYQIWPTIEREIENIERDF